MTPIYNAVPVKSFVTTGNKAVQHLLGDVSTKTMLRISTATDYSGARILCRLAMDHPDLVMSHDAVTMTIASESRQRVR
jgi:hypothetical protein